MPFNIISKIISKQDKETQSLTPQPLAEPVTPGVTEGESPFIQIRPRSGRGRVLIQRPRFKQGQSQELIAAAGQVEPSLLI